MCRRNLSGLMCVLFSNTQDLLHQIESVTTFCSLCCCYLRFQTAWYQGCRTAWAGIFKRMNISEQPSGAMDDMTGRWACVSELSSKVQNSSNARLLQTHPCKATPDTPLHWMHGAAFLIRILFIPYYPIFGAEPGLFLWGQQCSVTYGSRIQLLNQQKTIVYLETGSFPLWHKVANTYSCRSCSFRMARDAWKRLVYLSELEKTGDHKHLPGSVNIKHAFQPDSIWRKISISCKQVLQYKTCPHELKVRAQP